MMLKQKSRVWSGEKNHHQAPKCFDCKDQGSKRCCLLFLLNSVIHRDFVREGKIVKSEFCVSAQERFIEAAFENGGPHLR
jgi:hypothetical protein